MSIVAPISATGAAVPVLVGVVAGERPGVGQVVGLVLVLRQVRQDEGRFLRVGVALDRVGDEF